jgi:predicted nucleotidyltransferase component of viral defense system
MLQKETVVQEITDLIKELQNDSLFKDYVLVGGTALALQLGHRTSTDIDLFTPKKQNVIGLIDYFKKCYKNTNIEVAKDDFIRLYANGIKVEMVWYEENTIKNVKNEDGIKLVGINEIATMKLNAITKRTEPRDFIDIAYLLKEISLEEMFDLYKENFGSISPLYMKRTLLTKSKNIKESDWLIGGIKMLRHDIEPKDVPMFIEKAIEEYNKNINVGKK